MKPIEIKREAFRKKYASFLSNSALNTFLVICTLIGSLLYAGNNFQWGWLAFITLPIAFVYAEAVFYLAHRYQQHQEVRFQEFAFNLHTFWHHGMFSTASMSVDSFKDMNMVLLPFFIHAMVIGLVYLPLALLLQHYFGSQIGWMIMFAVAAQLTWYEIVHTFSHLDDPPMLKRLARHHKTHHDHGLMGEYNFGIGTTLFDHVFRTYYRSPK